MTELQESSYKNLVRLLQLAYSAELAAAFAYRGHWHSVSDLQERARILQIENEEWHHRDLVGEMLKSLGESPSARRERRSWWIGKVLASLCHVMGWLAPMYGAGRLESGNVREYENAARFARDCGHEEFVDCLLAMAEVEWEHEYYFRSRVQLHRLGRRLKLWTAPPPKENIRGSYTNEAIAQRPVAAATSEMASVPSAIADRTVD